MDRKERTTRPRRRGRRARRAAVVTALGIAVSPLLAVPAGARVTPPPNCSGGYVALTFDDGPSARTPRLLNELSGDALHATFFDVGKNVALYPRYARAEVDRGFMVEDHTYNHGFPLTWLSPANVTSELETTRDLIQRVTGVKPPFYRPPYGATNDSVRADAAPLGLAEVLWTVTTKDYQGLSTPPADAQQIAAAVGTAKDGDIVLMHDASFSNSIEAMSRIAETLADRDVCSGRIVPTATTFLPNGQPISVKAARW